MSKQNLKSAKSNINPVKISDRLPYHPPKFHYLGALEQIQGEYNGRYCDASGRYYD